MARFLGDRCPTCNGMVQPLSDCPTCTSVLGRPCVVKMIQKMPDIWDDTDFVTSRKAVLGQLANCAVWQSPYLVPKDLATALEQFTRSVVWQGWDEFFHTNCKQLMHAMLDAFDECPAIQAWNIPRKGPHETVFVSRYDAPQPDYDIVDLDVLARNVAHGITLQAKYDGLHD